MGKQRYTNGILYKVTTLDDEKRDLVLAFLNNQANATQSLHRVLLHHIERCGVGEVLDFDVQKIMYATSNDGDNKISPSVEQAELQKLAEQAKQAELARQQAEQAKQAAELEKQQAEQARQAELEKQQAEQARRAELEKQQAETTKQAVQNAQAVNVEKLDEGVSKTSIILTEVDEDAF